MRSRRELWMGPKEEEKKGGKQVEEKEEKGKEIGEKVMKTKTKRGW